MLNSNCYKYIDFNSPQNGIVIITLWKLSFASLLWLNISNMIFLVFKICPDALPQICDDIHKVYTYISSYGYCITFHNIIYMWWDYVVLWILEKMSCPIRPMSGGIRDHSLANSFRYSAYSGPDRGTWWFHSYWSLKRINLYKWNEKE